MTSAPAGGVDPRQWLAGSRELARGVRRAQRVTWFPLLLLAAVTFAAIPIERFAPRDMTCRSFATQPGGPPGRVCMVYPPALLVYWPIALVLAYVAIAIFCVHRSREVGVGTRVRPYVVGGIVIAVVLTSVPVWVANHPRVGESEILGLHVPRQYSPVFSPVLGPTAAIGLGLLVLAWVDRSVAAVVVAIGYLVVVLTGVDFGWVIALPSPWALLPHVVIEGLVLALSGCAFAMAQRGLHRPVG